MTRLSESVARVRELITEDLSADAAIEAVLTESTARRRMDLSDLTPTEQAALVTSRSAHLLPGEDALAARITEAAAKNRPFKVKLGIDPTAPDVHLGHAVPMIILSRFQRMGHEVTLIIGDITAKIGDPSQRSTERPTLTDAEIAANLRTYQDQVAPFFDFGRAEFRHNSEWLAGITLPQLLEILGRVPVSMSLQREDFRTRIAEGQGLAMSEFIYSVVMGLDSVEIECDVEIGGIDQLLNMQMCRKLMEIEGQAPELIVTTPLIEGTDGSGAKMSKSKGNYVPLTATTEDLYGKIMSIPDRLMAPYFRAWTEWTDSELADLEARMQAGTLHPMDAKRLLAGEAVAALHGVDAAMKARATFQARFSRRSYSEVELPVLSVADHGAETIGALLTGTLAFTASNGASRRIAQQNGLKLVIESDGDQRMIPLDEAALNAPLADVVARAEPGDVYLKVGKKLARLLR